MAIFRPNTDNSTPNDPRHTTATTTAGTRTTTAPTPGAASAKSAAADDSIIAEGMVVHGNCEARGGIRVDGRVVGSVQAARVVVGAGGHVEGDVLVAGGASARGGEVLVEGEVAGGVQAARVEVGRTGKVGAGMRASEAVVHGRVVGGIVADHRLVLEPTAEVKGDVESPRLAIREAARIDGLVRTATARTAAAPKASGGAEKKDTKEPTAKATTA